MSTYISICIYIVPKPSPAARPDYNNSYNQNFIITMMVKFMVQEEEISFILFERTSQSYERNMRNCIGNYHTDFQFSLRKYVLGFYYNTCFQSFLEDLDKIIRLLMINYEV